MPQHDLMNESSANTHVLTVLMETLDSRDADIDPAIREMARRVVSCTSPDTGSMLHQMLCSFIKSDCEVTSRPDSRIIMLHIERLMERGLKDLRAEYPDIFNQSAAVLLGSVAEKTKTIKMDEADFVIFLPCLYNHHETWFPVKSNMYNFPVSESCVNYIKDNVEEAEWVKGWRGVFGAGLTLRRLIVNSLRRNVEIIPGLKYIKDCTYHKATAVTFKLNDSVMKLDISVGMRDESLTSSRCNRLVQSLGEQPPLAFYIINHVGTRFLLTTTFAESRVMHDLSGTGAGMAYQLTKCLAHYFLADYKQRHCECPKSAFPSYHIKLILFYLKHDGKSESWSFDELSNRVLEIIAVYALCLDQEATHNIFHDIGNTASMDNEWRPLYGSDVPRHSDDRWNAIIEAHHDRTRYNALFSRSNVVKH